MKRTPCFTLALLAAMTAAPGWADTPAPTAAGKSPRSHTASAWSKLWQTPDQRAQALLHDGDAATAAATFRDPRHKAYAQAQAGDNASAAEAWGAFDDAEAQYNRGNALARSGDLQAALDAYDAALTKDPSLEDAQRNRKLVEQALQQQKQQQQQSQNGDGKSQDDQQSNDGSDRSQQGDQNASPSGSDPQDQSRDGSSQKGAQNADSPQQQPQPQPQTGDSSKPDDARQAGDENPGHAQSAQDQTGMQDTEDQSNDADQAKRDASAGLATQQQDGDPPPPADSQPAVAAQADETDAMQTPQNASAAVTADGEAPSEKQLAQDQWLRRIPDDPGGLLRRKFMIEHLMKQQQEAQP